MAIAIPSYLRLSRHNVFYFRWPSQAHGRASLIDTRMILKNDAKKSRS